MAILLSGSGGGPRAAFLATAAVEVAKRRKFKYFVGVSASAVFGVPLALGMYDEVIKTTTTLKHKDFFKVSPMNKKGGFTFCAIIRALLSFIWPSKLNSFGVQDIRPLLSKFVTKDHFNNYQNGDYPIVYICAVNADTQKPELFNVKDKAVSYEKYLDIVAASSRIPVWTQPQEIDGALYYDGGVTDTNASTLVLEEVNDITQVISIYPRPENFEGKKAPKIRGIVGAIAWTIDTMLKDVSKNDQREEIDICSDKGIKLTQIFPTKYVLTSLYDTDPLKLLLLSNMAKKAVKEALNT